MNKSVWIPRIVGLVLAVSLCAALWAVASTAWYVSDCHGLLIAYALILMAPLAGCCAWRLVLLARHGFKRLPKQHARRVYLGTAAAFFSLTVLAYSIESWRGRRAYAALKRQVEARGDSLALSAVIPPPVPEEENFCATPLLRKLVDYQFDTAVLPYGRNQLRWRDPELIHRFDQLRAPTWSAKWSRFWLEGQFTDLRAWAAWFAQDPIWGENLSTNQPAEAILQATSRFAAEYEELRAASKRPATRWELRYEDGFFVQIGLDRRSEFLDKLVSSLILRTLAELELGQSEAALADWKLALRLVQSTQNEPSFHSHYRRLEKLLLMIQPIWEGLARAHWSEAHLVQIQEALGRIDLNADWPRALRGEIYLYLDLLQRVPGLFSFNTIWRNRGGFVADSDLVGFALGWLFYPRGWAYEDQVVLYRVYETWIAGRDLCCVTEKRPSGRMDAPRRAIDPLLYVFVYPRLRQMIEDVDVFCYVQFQVQAARVACALERYRQAHQTLPTALEALLPEYLEALPVIPGGQNPFVIYEPGPDQRYRLHPPLGSEVKAYFWRLRLKDAPALWPSPVEPAQE